MPFVQFWACKNMLLCALAIPGKDADVRYGAVLSLKLSRNIKDKDKSCWWRMGRTQKSVRILIRSENNRKFENNNC